MLTLITILGSLGIFLYGMKVMSEGIQKIAGNGFRKALAKATSNRFSAALTGLLMTTLVLSSSATTVFVVSFANAGLLTLVEAIGVIMGANLGTTITAWFVAVVGVKISIAKIALPVIGIGLPIFLLSKGWVKYLGEAMIGFGLLFFGLGELKEAVPNLKEAAASGDTDTLLLFQSIIDWIQSTGFFSIVFFMLAGVALTLVVQSSTAAMAITIVCALNGLLGDNSIDVFKNASAIVLGENIGTTVTAWLASIGATVNAKRAARAHLLFNVLGVIWMLILFVPFTNTIWTVTDHLPEVMKDVTDKSVSQYDVDTKAQLAHQEHLTNRAEKAKEVKKNIEAKGGTISTEELEAAVTTFLGAAKPLEAFLTSSTENLNKSKIAFSVAIFHTSFNLINIMLLIGFVPTIAKLVKLMVKNKGITDHLKYVSHQFVDMPQLNIPEAEHVIKDVSQNVLHMLNSLKKILPPSRSGLTRKLTEMKDMETKIDLMVQDLTKYLVRCSSKEVSSNDATRIASLLNIVSELENCSDSLFRLSKHIEQKHSKNHIFSPSQIKAMNDLYGQISKFFDYMHAHLLEPMSPKKISKAASNKDEIKALLFELNESAMVRMADGDVKVEMANIGINSHLYSLSKHALKIIENSATMHSNDD